MCCGKSRQQLEMQAQAQLERLQMPKISLDTAVFLMANSGPDKTFMEFIGAGAKRTFRGRGSASRYTFGQSDKYRFGIVKSVDVDGLLAFRDSRRGGMLFRVVQLADVQAVIEEATKPEAQIVEPEKKQKRGRKKSKGSASEEKSDAANATGEFEAVLDANAGDEDEAPDQNFDEIID